MSEERSDKQLYVEPKVLATYSKEELEEAIRPHGPSDSYTDNGCGGGSIL